MASVDPTEACNFVCCYDLKFFLPGNDSKEVITARRKMLFELARTLDSDKQFGDRLRTTDLWDNPKSKDSIETIKDLENLARTADKERQFKLIEMLGELMRFAELDQEPLLREVRLRHRDDFWLNFNLARFFQEKSNPTERDLNESIRFYEAALAASPNNEVASENLKLAESTLQKKRANIAK
jgi:hypothetical protein